MKKVINLLPLCTLGALFLLAACSPKMNKAFRQEIELHRTSYVDKFLDKPNSPLSESDLKALKFFPPDADYRVEAQIDLTPDEEPFDMDTYAGTTQPYRQYGWLEFELKGKTYIAAVYQNLSYIRIPASRHQMFLPFMDHTSGESTYGGGRYIDLSVNDIKDGKLVIDFNKAYNPYCAYKDGYQCPIPPAENHLEVRIEAGEKRFGK